MKTAIKIALSTLAVLALAGCSHQAKTSGMPGTGGMPGDGTQAQGIGGVNGFNGQSFTSGGLETLSAQDQAQLVALTKKVYFAFDSNALSSEGQQVAQANAAFLLQHPAVFVLLEGNADPRGSQEYNFHLGERRANAVQSYFLQQGVAASQICIVSYGELKPAASPAQFNGDWQKAYQLDRRVEVVYGQTCQGQTAAPASTSGAAPSAL